MTNNDLISIIIPIYNCEYYVRQTLESVVNQTYKNIEILLIDDGSTDKSLDICKEFSFDKRIKTFERENSGISIERQFGLDVCQGEYFVTLDSDDYVALDYIEKLYKSIKENNADISICGVNYFDDGSSLIRIAYMPPSDIETLHVNKELLESSFYKISKDMLLTDSWNKMYRTAFVKESNVKFELAKIYNGTDLQFNHGLAVHCPTYSTCHEPLLYHRGRPGSKVRKKNKSLQEGFEIITQSLIKECINENISAKKELSKIYYSLVGLVIVDAFLYGGKKKHQCFKAIIKRNRSFLKNNKEYLQKFRGFKKFQISNNTLPAFALSNAIFLDIAALFYASLQKRKIKKIKANASKQNQA